MEKIFIMAECPQCKREKNILFNDEIYNIANNGDVDELLSNIIDGIVCDCGRLITYKYFYKKEI